jgi:hypothetical protein
MTKAQDTTAATESNVPAVDLSTLSVKELADMLAKARQAEKAKKAEVSSLPQFAYVLVMEDSSLVYWSGRAASAADATQAAIAYAESEGKKVFVDGDGLKGIAARPIPQPRGRKAKAQDAS